jgi:ribonuclease HII
VSLSRQVRRFDGVADSKLLSPRCRQALFAAISEAAIAVGIGQADVEEVDRINVYWAAMEARRRAVKALAVVPAHVLVDGKRRIAGCCLAQTMVVEGDARSAWTARFQRSQCLVSSV